MSKSNEDRLISRVYQGVLDRGYSLRVDYGEGDRTQQLGSIKELLGSLRACDEEWLDVETKGGKAIGSISLVYSNGNDGLDVISDYTGGLDKVMHDLVTAAQSVSWRD